MKTILLLCALLLAACEGTDITMACGALVPVRVDVKGQETSFCADDLCRGKVLCAGKWQALREGPWYTCTCPRPRTTDNSLLL